jgi:hypothetical protein
MATEIIDHCHGRVIGITVTIEDNKPKITAL